MSAFNLITSLQALSPDWPNSVVLGSGGWVGHINGERGTSLPITASSSWCFQLSQVGGRDRGWDTGRGSVTKRCGDDYEEVTNKETTQSELPTTLQR